jgi:nicotinate-nucleotide adenylyltransferase
VRIAVYGGSLNPVGDHHVALVKALLATGRYDRVVVVPNGDGYGKPGLVSGRHRLAMCCLAFSEMPRVLVSDLETGMEPGKVGRDADTLEALATVFPGALFDSVRGADTLGRLLGFETYARLAAAVQRFVVVSRRTEKQVTTLESAVAKLTGRKRHQYQRDVAKFVSLDLDFPPGASSSAIRGRLAKGGSVHGLVPMAVAGYIRDQGLYREAGGEGRKPSKGRKGPRSVTDPRQVVLRHRPRNNSYILDADANGLYWCARFDAMVGTGAATKRFEPDSGNDVAGQEERWRTLCATGSVPDPARRVRISVASRSRDGFALLSPFAMRPGGFPVPGLLGSAGAPICAHSVENAWQGLKCYPDGHPEPFTDLVTYAGASLKLKAWLRHLDRSDLADKRYRYWVHGRQTDDKAEAVFLTYFPMYIWCIETFAPEFLDRLAQTGKEKVVWLWDTDSSEDISQDEAFSHAAFLVHYLNGGWFAFYRQFWPAAGKGVEDWLAQLPEPYRSELPALLRRRPA